MMQRTWLVGLAVAAAIVVLPNAGFAQVRSDSGKAAHAMKPEAKDWDKLLEKIRPVYLKKLGEELNLDEETIGKMAQSFDQFRGQRSELNKERKALVAKLRDALERKAPDSELESILTEYDSVRNRRHQLWSSRQAEVRQILGTRGFAQYVLFQKKFRREIHKTLREVKKNPS